MPSAIQLLIVGEVWGAKSRVRWSQHDKAESVTRFMVSTVWGEGGDKKSWRNSVRSGLEAYETSDQTYVHLRPGMVLRVCLGSTKAHSSTQSNSPGNPYEESAKAKATRTKAKQAEKQAGWRKSGRWKWKGQSKKQKSEKWETRPTGGGGGGSKKTLMKNKIRAERVKWLVRQSSEIKKTESHMLIIMARVRRYRLAQGQARQTKSNKENRKQIRD
jgi:hypothetical protein